MEVAVIAGLGLIGSYIAKNNKHNNDPILEPSKIKQSSNKEKDVYRENIKKKIKIIESNENKADLEYSNGYENDNLVKLFPTEFNSKVHHIYDTRIVPTLDYKYYDKAAEQREKSKIPERTNVIPPLFNQPYKNYYASEKQLTMGSVPVSEFKNNESSYTSQFNLQTADNIGEPAASGDIWNTKHKNETSNFEKELIMTQKFSPFNTETFDMTLGMVPKEKFIHNNMQKFTSKRDIGVDENNNFEYNLEIFSGSSKNWNPKRETIPFFNPEEYKETPFGTPNIEDEERDRTVISKIKQNERPFEPVHVGPGLNLNYDQPSTHGFHDTFRAMELDTNELRPQNKPKLSYEGRFQAPQRKGEKRGIISDVKKRRPLHWRYQTVDDLTPNRAVNTAQADTGTWIIPNNARTETTTQLMAGPAIAPTQVGAKNREGKVKITKRITHVEDKLGPKNPTERFTPNAKSYNILLNERNTTNYDDVMPATKLTQGNTAFDPNDLAKGTKKQTLSEREFNTAIGGLLGTYTNLPDEAKQTIKQILSTQTYNQMVSCVQHNVYTNLPDEAKKTIKQILSLCEFNNFIGSTQQGTYSDPQDLAKDTIKQMLTRSEFNTNIGSAQKSSYTNYFDQAKLTTKQLLETMEFNTNVGPNNQKTYAEFVDKAKSTIKELTELLEFNNNLGTTQKETYAEFTDNAKTTIKELSELIEFNNNMKTAQQGTYSDYMDQAKSTIKQLIETMEFNNNIGSAQKNGYSNLSDLPKTTNKETLTEKEFNTFLARTLGTYSDLSDEAKITLKQILATQKLNTMIGMTKKEAYTNLSDEAKITLKQLLTLQTFSTHIRQNIGTYTNLPDEAKITLKQILSVIENNNNVKSAQQGSYTNLMDLAKITLKEFLAEQQLNNNVGVSRNEKGIAIDYNDLPKITHKQDLLNENYITTAVAAGFNKKPQPQKAERNMRQNITKEIIAKGVSPTLSGPKLIPTKDNYISMKQRNKPCFNRSNPPSLTTKINLEDRKIFRGQYIKQKAAYDERLYQELLDQFDDNPIVNNIQTTTNAKFKKN